MPGVPPLEFLAAAPLPLIFPLIGVVDVQDDEAGFVLQDFLEHDLTAAGPVAGHRQIDGLGGNIVPAQFIAQEPGVGRFEAGSPGDGVAHHKDAEGPRGPMALKGLGVEAPPPGPEEFHRAVGALIEARLGIVAVVEAAGNILGEKDAGAHLRQDQQADNHKAGGSDEPFHQN